MIHDLEDDKDVIAELLCTLQIVNSISAFNNGTVDRRQICQMSCLANTVLMSLASINLSCPEHNLKSYKQQLLRLRGICIRMQLAALALLMPNTFSIRLITGDTILKLWKDMKDTSAGLFFLLRPDLNACGN